eukprot:6103561-Amphidinium_carterae.1
MDARDAMRGEQLMADFVTSGAWDEREAPSSFFGGPKIASLGGFAEDCETAGFTENCEIVGTGFLKEREAVFDSDADCLTWEDLAAQALPIRNFASLEEEW